MTFFWIATVLLTVAMAALLAIALLRGQRSTGPAELINISGL